MMKLAVVKTEAQYREYIARMEELAALDPAPDSSDGEELELLSVLVGDYEDKAFKFGKPDPVEAVKFRMHEQDLRQVDLVPYFGSRSRVSEFLARQRPLTVQMIRDLSVGLGIPTEVLIQESVDEGGEREGKRPKDYDWTKFPIREMAARGWIRLESERRRNVDLAAKQVQAFIEKTLGGSCMGLLTRRTIKGDAFSWQAIYSLTAWQARVLEKAGEPANQPRARFKLESLSEEFFSSVVRCSRFSDGPLRAVQLLKDVGIAVVVEEHLAKTKLDGAAMLSSSGVPVIGLTLRFNRTDNFWFTLLHECAHVWKHLSKPGDTFLDRLADKESTETLEKEANRVARDLLIPRAVWRSASVRTMPTKAAIISFAEEHSIHPAIVAGRIQKEQENYSLFRDLTGQGGVKHLFGLN